MQGQQVDPTPLAEFAVTGLHLDPPTIPLEPRGDGLDNRRVLLVEQAHDICAAADQAPFSPQIQNGCVRAEDPHRCEGALLAPPDGRSRKAAAVRHVPQAPAPTDAQHPEESANLEIPHDPIWWPPRLIGR